MSSTSTFFFFFSFDCDMFHHWQFAYENTLCCFWAVVREDTVVPCSSVQRFLIVTSTRTAIFGLVHITVTYSLTLANFANGNSNSFAFTPPISVCGTVRARHVSVCQFVRDFGSPHLPHTVLAALYSSPPLLRLWAIRYCKGLNDPKRHRASR